MLLPDIVAAMPAPWPTTVALALLLSVAPLPMTVEFWPPAEVWLPTAVASRAPALD